MGGSGGKWGRWRICRQQRSSTSGGLTQVLMLPVKYLHKTTCHLTVAYMLLAHLQVAGSSSGWNVGGSGVSCSTVCSGKGGCPDTKNFLSLVDTQAKITSVMASVSLSCNNYYGSSSYDAPGRYIVNGGYSCRWSTATNQGASAYCSYSHGSLQRLCWCDPFPASEDLHSARPPIHALLA